MLNKNQYLIQVYTNNSLLFDYAIKSLLFLVIQKHIWEHISLFRIIHKILDM